MNVWILVVQDQDGYIELYKVFDRDRKANEYRQRCAVTYPGRKVSVFPTVVS